MRWQAHFATLDHFEPVDGRNDREFNYRICCYRCNQLKQDMFPLAWFMFMESAEYDRAVAQWDAHQAAIESRRSGRTRSEPPSEAV